MKKGSGNFKKTIAKKLAADYLLYLPANYNKTRKQGYPLLLYLHASGNRGSDLDKVRVDGPPGRVESGVELPFIILAPQCREKEWWDVDTLGHLLDKIIKAENVDETRLYVTGMSMGGQGTWMMANAFPGRFAAIAPVCGPELRTRDARNFRDTPVWCFHGARDEAVPLRDSFKMVDAIRGEGGSVKFTIYPDTAHDSWTETYNNPELYKWFLKHKR